MSFKLAQASSIAFFKISILSEVKVLGKLMASKLLMGIFVLYPYKAQMVMKP